MRFHPEVMVKPDDYEIFTLNKNGKTYSNSEIKRRFPKHVHNEFTLRSLEDSNFIPLIKCPKMFTLYHEQKRISNNIRLIKVSNEDIGDYHNSYF